MTDARRGLRLGLGPVFAFETRACSRRWQWYAGRALFVAMLLAALFVVHRNRPSDSATIQGMAKLGQNFYVALVGMQLTLVLLAAPAATAGAVCHDRATGMMTHVLVTDLTPAEIVVGKLAARLVPVLGLIACGLPLATLLTLLGGVDPDALFGAFLVTVGLAALGCSLAFAFSLWAKKPHEALLGAFAVWALWLLGRPFVNLLNSSFGLALNVPPMLDNPYALCFRPYWWPGSVSAADYVWFAGLCLAASAALTGLSILMLRRVCTRTDVPRKSSLRGRLAEFGERLDPFRWLPEPRLDFNPILWREWRRTQPSGLGRVISGLYALGAATASAGAIVAPRSTFAMAWVNGLQVSIGMLLLAVAAATALAEERVRGSLDVLMTTTLSTREIVVGKWLGSFRRVPLLALLPTLVVLCGDPWKSFYIPTILTTFLFVLACGAAVSALGLLAATWCARPGRAVAATVSIYVLLAVVPLFVGGFLGGPNNEGAMMLSPFFFAGELAADLCSQNSGRQHIDAAFAWICFYGVLAATLLVLTLRTFNHCLGRVEDGWSLPGRLRPERRLVAPPRPNLGDQQS